MEKPPEDDDLELSPDDDLLLQTGKAGSEQPAESIDDMLMRAQIKEHGAAIAKLERSTLSHEVQLREHSKLLRAFKRVIKRILIFLKQGI